MTTTRRTQSALRAALKKEDAALEKRLPESGAQATAAASEMAPDKPAAKVRPRAATTVAPKARPKATSRAVRKVEQPPVASAAASPAPVPVPQKPEKRIRETFSMTRQDLLALKAVRARIEKAGGKVSRSELLRAGILLLSGQPIDDVSRLTGSLPPLRKDGRKGK